VNLKIIIKKFYVPSKKEKEKKMSKESKNLLVNRQNQQIRQ
jgi:hypothetical protein